MAPQPLPSEWEIPKLRCSFGFEDDGDGQSDTEFFDVKFYPYGPVGADPVFAAVSNRHAVVCRLVQAKDVNPCQIIQVIRDADPGALNCSCTWTKDAQTERPYLCVAGGDGKVKVYDVKEGKVAATLVGHGGEINDLATSPANPLLIASASDDTTVRIWSLDPVHARQPCVCLLAGEGHSWNLLSVAFHRTGRYVLSAGHDQVINLWTVPDLPRQHTDVPQVVHYPHFSTREIHTGLIDCVAFYGDAILSRACHEDVIVLWRIEGFSSEDPVPSPDIAPSAHDTSKLTRSAFMPSNSASGQAQYTRLLQFHTPGCGPQFFMRFSMFNAAGHHPVLAFCNAASKIFFWDMRRLTAYHEFVTAMGNPNRDKSVPLARPAWLKPIAHRKRPGGDARAGGGGDVVTRLRDASTRGGSGSGAGGDRDAASDKDSANFSEANGGGTPDPDRVGFLSAEYSQETIEDWEKKYNIGDPHALVKAHRVEATKGFSVVGRQVAWSPDGDWCVVVGSSNRAIVLQRWAGGGGGENTPAADDGGD